MPILRLIVRLFNPLIRPDRNAAEIRSSACWILGSIGKVPSSVKYVHQKDAHLHSAVARVLGLEEIKWME